ILPLFLNGFSIDNLLEEKKNNLKTSKRKIILVKGYHGWAGRALVALYALKIIKEYLSDYKIVIYSADDISVKISAELFENETNINVALVPLNTSHSEMLKLQGSARLHIGLSISDGIPSSVLEAMAMGSFPIQSWTAATDEWIKDGENGFLVSPEDPCNVAEAMVKALTNDKLVDNAAKINWKIVKTRLNYNDLKQKAINSYRSIFEDIKNNI
ncbi:MAG: glycosyltransferase, partial [Methanobrevibacter sp.]|nr:glycosyltransferase [Methanobrevibacter sp.]